MKLQDFVASSLSDIITGVAMAQEMVGQSGALISPALEFSGGEEETIFYYYDSSADERRHATRIEFEVAVTTRESEEAKGGVGLFATAIGLGVQAQIEGATSEVGKIKFSVPVVFPLQRPLAGNDK